MQFCIISEKKENKCKPLQHFIHRGQMSKKNQTSLLDSSVFVCVCVCVCVCTFPRIDEDTKSSVDCLL